MKFDTFHGTKDKLKALAFIQQFDAAFSGGNFTEASKVRKAASFLKGNALQWWSTLLMQGQHPKTWLEFKQLFSSLWLTQTYEADVISAWNQMRFEKGETLDQYNERFWNTCLPVSSFRPMTLPEQMEKYVCQRLLHQDQCVKHDSTD